MSTTVVDEDDKAFNELSEQRRMKASQYSNVQQQILAKKKIKRRSELCLAEVDQLPETTVSYKAVGRMFVACPLPQIKKDLNGLITKAQDDITRFEPQEKALQNEIEELDKTIEEMSSGEEAKQ